MNKRHSVFALVLLLAFTWAALAIPAAQAAPITGTDGTYTWTIDETGKLILPAGQMISYTTNAPGWKQHAAQITAVEIQPGATAGAGIYSLFSGLSQVKEIDLRNLDISQTTNMRAVFQLSGSTASPLKIIGLENWDVSKVTSFHDMFRTGKFESLAGIQGWKTSSLTNMDSFLYQGFIASPDKLDLSGWDVSKVTDLNFAFASLSISDYSIKGWNLAAQPLRIPRAFGGNMTRLELTHWNNLYVPVGSYNSEDVFWVRPQVLMLNPNFKFYPGDGFTFSPAEDDTYTGLWQAVAGGTETAPAGAAYTIDQLRALYPGTSPNGPAETYVWQRKVPLEPEEPVEPEEPIEPEVPVEPEEPVVPPPAQSFETLHIPLIAKKVLQNGGLKGGDFTFLLKDAKGKVIDQKTNGADGSIAFIDRTFNKVVSNYLYTIVEQPGKDDSITYDNTVYTVKISTRPEGNKLKATVHIEKNGTPYDGALTFTNIRKAPQTGDSIARTISLLLALALLFTLAAYILKQKQRKHG